jgi:hypothetical protein
MLVPFFFTKNVDVNFLSSVVFILEIRTIKVLTSLQGSAVAG